MKEHVNSEISCIGLKNLKKIYIYIYSGNMSSVENLLLGKKKKSSYFEMLTRIMKYHLN